MATQQRQHGLISDEYGFLVGSRRLEQGIESVDDKVQRIVDLLENKTKPTKIFNSRTVAQNHVAKSVDKLVALTEKTAKESQRIKAVNSQTLRNNGENRIATRPTKVVNSQTGATNSSESVGSLAAELSTDQPTRTVNSQTGATNSSESVGSSATELSTDQPTRTVNSQTSQQAQDRQRDANGRFIGGEGEQSKSSGGLFKGMTQAVRNGFLQANSDGQNLDPSIDALYEVKNILSPVGRVAALTLRPLGALFKSKKRNEPLSREEEKHNKKEIKLLERIARMGGGGGGLLGGLLGRGGGFLGKLFKGGGKLLKFGKGIPLVGALLTAMSFSGWSGKSTKEKGSTVGAGVGGIAGGAIGSLLGPVGTIVGASVGAWVGDKLGGVVAPYFKVWTDSLVKADIPAMLSKAWDGFIDLVSKAFNVSPVGAAIEAGKSAVDWIKEKVSGTNVPKYLLQKQHGGYGVDAASTNDSTQSAGGAAPANDSPQSAGDAHKPSGKAGKNFTPEKAKKIAEVANRIGVNPNDLASIISFETARSFSPSAKNPKSSATGLIQFMSGSGGTKGKYYGMTRDQFSGLSFDEQMNYVEKYYKDRGFDGKTKRSLADAYTAVTGYGYKKGSKEYGLNKVWDSNKDGYIAKGEMVQNPSFKAHQKDYYQDQPSNQSTAQPTKTPIATPKSTTLPPTISKPPVVPSLSLKPTIDMKAQPIQFRSAAKVEAIPKIESVPEMHTSPKPMLVQSVNSGDNIGQNLSDRGLAHLVTGGLGENRYGA